MPKKSKKSAEEAAPVDENAEPPVKERLHLTRCEYMTILYIVNSALTNFAYPDPSLDEHSQLIGVSFSKSRSALGSMNFIFSGGKTELDVQN